MKRKTDVLPCMLALLTLIGLSTCTQMVRADTNIYGADVRGEYVGRSASHWGVVFFINDQSSYWDTGNGTHRPWSHISGTISLDFGPDIPFTGVVHWGGEMEISYWVSDGWGYQHGSYTAFLMDSGANYETSQGSYTVDEWIYDWNLGWSDFQVDAGWFYVFRI